MNPALIELVVHAINEKYTSEKAFYSEKLRISPQSWDRWKKGEQGLKYDNIQILSTVFTDYEWMLVQKVVRNSEIIPEVVSNPVKEFEFLKYQIARKWINSGVAQIDWFQSDENIKSSGRKSNMVILQVKVDYNLWGYSDIIELRLPGVIRQQIGHDEVKLLQWFENESERMNETK